MEPNKPASWREAYEALAKAVAAEARGLICGHHVCGCTKHNLIAALRETRPEVPDAR